MILRCFLLAGIFAQLHGLIEPDIELSDIHGPQLVDDIRYTPENAAYYRSLGLVIDEKYITEPSGGPGTTVDATTSSKIWNNRPFTDSEGNTRYRVYFGFVDGLPDDTKEKVRKNLQTLQSQVCINFEETTDEAAHKAEGLVKFIKSTGCWSGVGWSSGIAKISIAKDCTSDGTIQHEVMHTLGFHHEQSRPDRDNYVVIHYDAVF